jgi:hypothetical protein
MKHSLPLDSTTKVLQGQIQVAILPGPANRAGPDGISPYENLHSLVKHTISPYFNSCAKGDSEQPLRYTKSHEDAKTGITRF